MKITVRKKDFNIELVSNYVHKLYSELVADSWTITETETELRTTGREHLENIKGVKDKEHIKELNKEFNENVLAGNRRIKECAESVISKREVIIRELVETNGYDYDQEWWEKRTSPEDMNDFMLACLKNDKTDNKEYGKKK